MIFNVLIPSYERVAYLNICLKYLIDAVEYRGGDVNICIGVNKKENVFHQHSSLHVFEIPFEYSKSSYNNRILKQMPQDYDALLFIDCDMIYIKKLFVELEEELREFDYITMQGYKLSEESTKKIFKYPLSIEEIDRLEKEEFKVSPSQICLRKKTYQFFLKYFKEPFFDEFYKGWGCEDSDISFKSRFLIKQRIIKKTNLFEKWYHLYHSSTYNKEAYNRNFIYFENKRKKNGY